MRRKRELKERGQGTLVGSVTFDVLSQAEFVQLARLTMVTPVLFLLIS